MDLLAVDQIVQQLVVMIPFHHAVLLVPQVLKHLHQLRQIRMQLRYHLLKLGRHRLIVVRQLHIHRYVLIKPEVMAVLLYGIQPKARHDILDLPVLRMLRLQLLLQRLNLVLESQRRTRALPEGSSIRDRLFII